MKLNCVTSYPSSNTQESCVLLSVYEGPSYRPILLTLPSFPFHGIGKDAMERGANIFNGCSMDTLFRIWHPIPIPIPLTCGIIYAMKVSQGGKS